MTQVSTPAVEGGSAAPSAADSMRRGPVRVPINSAADVKGSIHDDATAQKLGFRGGTVAGSIHMDQFPPMLVEAFGRGWFETGSLSLTFRNATTSGEPTIAMITPASTIDSPTGDAQTTVRMEREDGLVVAEGTASVGDAGLPSHLHAIDLRPSDPAELKMFAELRPGHPVTASEEVIAGADLRTRIDEGRLTEPLEWYSGASPWGGAIAPPSSIVQLLYRTASTAFRPYAGDGAVGLFGAIEVRHLAGPVLLDTPYQVAGEVVAVGGSPKTEYVWFDSHATDSQGRRVASMRMQLRWMKASARQYGQI